MSIAASTEGPPDIASSSHEYASRFSGKVGKYFLEVQQKAIAKSLTKQTNLKTVLEVGGGHCQLTNFYLDHGLRVTIQGSNEFSLQRAKDLGFTEITTLKISPLSPLEFADNSFDLVSGIRLMAHVDDWKSFLNEMLRVSKTGIVFDFANIYTLNILTPILFKLKKKIESNTRPYSCQSTQEVKEHLKSLGCSEIICIPQFVCPMGIHRMLKSARISAAIESCLSLIGLNKLCGSPVIVFAKKA